MWGYFFNSPCTVEGCSGIAIGDRSFCQRCPARFCPEHLKSKWHACKKLENMRDVGQQVKDGQRKLLQDTLDSLDPSLVITQATVLRPGHTCTFTIPAITTLFKDSSYACMNLHLPLEFDDGVKWMVRVPLRRWVNPPRELREMVVASEVATMRMLHEAGVKVPNAWLPQPTLESKGDPPSDYFFEELIPGKSLPDTLCPLTYDQLPRAFCEKFFDDLAEHYIALSNINLPSRGIGSLYPIPGAPTSGPVGERYTLGPLSQFGPFMSPTPPYFLGPFKTQRERYLARLEIALNNTYTEKFRFQHKLRMYLWYKEMMDMVTEHPELGREDEEDRYYVRHGDDGLRQCMADEDGRLQGVLDWEWTYITTKSEAFAPSHTLYATQAWLLGDDSLTTEELLLIAAYERRSRPDLAECVRRGRPYQRLWFYLKGHYDHRDPRTKKINALRRSMRGAGAETVRSVDAWEKEAVERYGDDPRVRELAEKEPGRLVEWMKEGMVIKEKKTELART
ncbi:hypothetical protein IAT38_001932 [Cryptococcus sp. DSM 104549]